MTSSRPLLFLVALLAAVAALSQARAAPLDGETCARLKTEQGDLENAGVEQNVAKGPVWAKANLTPEKIQQVRRFIELEELILFRCRGKHLVTLPPEPEDNQDQAKKDKSAKASDDDDDDGKEAAERPADTPASRPAGKQETVISKSTPQAQPAPPPPGNTKAPAPGAAAKADAKQKPPAAQPAAKKAADKKAAEPGGTPSGTQTKAKAPPKAAQKAPAKAKVDDAYKAPQSDSALNPLGAVEKQ